MKQINFRADEEVLKMLDEMQKALEKDYGFDVSRNALIVVAIKEKYERMQDERK